MFNTVRFALFCQTSLQSLHAALHFVVICVWFSQTVSRPLLTWAALMLSLHLQAPASSKRDQQVAIWHKATAISFTNQQAQRIQQSNCANCQQNMLNYQVRYYCVLIVRSKWRVNNRFDGSLKGAAGPRHAIFRRCSCCNFFRSLAQACWGRVAITSSNVLQAKVQHTSVAKVLVGWRPLGCSTQRATKEIEV